MTGGKKLPKEKPNLATGELSRYTYKAWWKFQVPMDSCFAFRATNTGSILTKTRTVNAMVAICALHTVVQVKRITSVTPNQQAGVAVKHYC